MSRTSQRIVAALCLSLATLLCAVVNADACSWDYLIWMPHGEDADPLYRFVRDHKAGYIDRTGKVVIEPKFSAYGNHGGEFHDGLLEVGVSSGEYVDTTGKPVEPGLYRGWQFSEGLAPVMKGGKWGYIDKSGKVVIEPRFDDAAAFTYGRALVRQDGLYGYIDRRGELVIPPRFKYAESFTEGLAAVGVLYFEEPAGIYYINRDGRTVIPGPFRVASHFFKGLAHVELKQLKKQKGEGDWRTRRFAYIDTKGKTVFAYEYEEEY